MLSAGFTILSFKKIVGLGVNDASETLNNDG